jgi:predicted phosphodiesterase
MTLQYCEDLIVSDVHVGSCHFREEAFLDTMVCWRPERIIIAGDLLDNPRYAYIQSAVFCWLKGLRCREKLWIPGNHDRDIERYPLNYTAWVRRTVTARKFAGRFGMELVPFCELEWTLGRCIVVHGDQFDPFVGHGGMLRDFILLTIENLRWLLDSRDQSRFRLMREIGEGLVTHFDDVADRARQFACENGYRYIVKGHTHRMAYDVRGGVLRINPGAWDQTPSGFVTYVDGEEPVLHRMWRVVDKIGVLV